MATLASSLVGTLTASMGLWERVQDRRESHKQKQRDKKQDGEIKQLREKFEQAQKSADGRQHEVNDFKGRSGRDDPGENFERDRMMIQRMYDEGYGRMGSRFAHGDAIVENQLQAHIISLQQTVISVLQEALYSDRPLSRTDMARLVAASNCAREGSLEAMRQAQHRLGANQYSVRSPSPQHSVASSKREATATTNVPDQLFCRYSLDIQYRPNKPLASTFAPGGACQCPACGAYLDVTAEDIWTIGKRTPMTIIDKGCETDIMETREFRLGQRFVLKCHLPGGQYACVMCNRGRSVDAICRTAENLVKHVGTQHSTEELEREIDLREVKADARKLTLAAP